MIFSVLLCFLVTTLIQFCNTHVVLETRYECGAHGKFEYCIDGIPGCVIGCHCHPGYYFDTDTKICEPNVKLTQDFRRHYLDAEPTRANVKSVYTPTVTEPISIFTTSDFLEDRVDEIAKNTDDLGDWLYNQFFKTIENQVINNTNTDKDSKKKEDKPLTRRSGGSDETVFTQSRRKTRKSMRSSGKKKKHMKVHGLRRKLLRITEDDSLFDSESDSDTSGSSSDSDSDDSSSDDSSDTSSGGSGSDGKKSSQDDKDHGHKKVIIFNRRPKPPLPSFIFLPSMDTPFYPPIGLPAPPPMPMYPMVPVPPMAPMFPYIGTPKCDNEENNATNATTTTSTDPDTTTTTTITTTESEAESPDDPESKDVGRSILGKLRSRRPEKFISRANESGKTQKVKNTQRNKLMQKLRDKMKESKRMKPIVAQPPVESQDGESPIMEEPQISQEALTSHTKKQQKKRKEEMPNLEDVDFKYLSELIHRVNQSDAKNKLPPLPVDLNDDLTGPQTAQPLLQPSRRGYNPYSVANIQHESNLHRKLNHPGSDDIYYTNLGRQIASMIRNADSRIDHNVMNDAHREVPFHSVLNENSYVPRSYWERSVRSPRTHVGKLPDYLDESRTSLKQNYEKNLVNLENEVETFASTSAPLSLLDLENILNTMERAHVHITFENPSKNTVVSNASLNVNLLPKYVKTDPYKSLFKGARYVEYNPMSQNYVEEPKINISNTTVQQLQHRGENSNADMSFSNYWTNQNPRLVSVSMRNISAVHQKQMHNTNTTKNIFATDVYSNNNPQFAIDEYSNNRQFAADVHSNELQFAADVHSNNPQLAAEAHSNKPNFDTNVHFKKSNFAAVVHFNGPKFAADLHFNKPQFAASEHSNIPQFTADFHSNKPQFASEAIPNNPRFAADEYPNSRQFTINVHSSKPQFETSVHSNDAQFAADINSKKSQFATNKNFNNPQAIIDIHSNKSQFVANEFSNNRRFATDVLSNESQFVTDLYSKKPQFTANVVSNKPQFAADVHSKKAQFATDVSTNNPQQPKAKKSQVEYLQFLKNMPTIKHTSGTRPERKFISSPPILNYKSLKYFAGNKHKHKHHYMFEAATYPLRIPSFNKRLSKPLGKSLNPSYFHHELHHFDYFD